MAAPEAQMTVVIHLLSGDAIQVDGLTQSSDTDGSEYCFAGDVRRRLDEISPMPVGKWYYIFSDAGMLVDSDKVFAGQRYSGVRSEAGVQKYQGFTEHAYRLVFFYGEKYAHSGGPWHLRTILPNGTVDQDRPLPPGAERGLICYPYKQSIPEETAAQFQGSPWVWRREDGSNALVQTWPTQYNDSFRAKFNPHIDNYDSDKFDVTAAEEFKRCMADMFGAPAVEELGIKYCHSQTDNDKPAYVGSAEALIKLLTDNPEIQQDLSIVTMGATIDGPDRYGFTSRYVDGRGRSGLKGVSMDPACRYVLYTKKGWETMACVKLLEQFEREAELKKPGVMVE